MVGPLPVAELCDPTGAPFTFTHLSYVSGYRCADALTSGSVQFSVLALSQSDIDWAPTRILETLSRFSAIHLRRGHG